ncbi:FAD dependent oxidoreductase [Patellaria atrata CBS 101060]|uniref:FAD dependent oxidoreductase n=1 Tax=Patellaria atrata CBS 101060 TaxID=1346257 RepID=A0A9P4SFH0_9PEZI|nr:FAD dependent oxidoreductase [Patellaria atrata CBS 101060]
MEKPQYHVAIIGAGLGGLAAAIGISRAGHRVTVLEQAEVLGEVGAGIQIPPNSSRILRRYGLLEKVEAVSVRPRDFVLRRYSDGKVLSRQNVRPFTETEYGNPYLHVHRAELHKILADATIQAGAVIKLGSAVTSIDFDRPAVKIKGKPDFTADVIIGADGLRSVCREQLLGHPDPPRDTGDLAYRAVVKASDMRQRAELSDLIDNPSINYWIGPGAHAVCYLMHAGDLFNIVIACPDTLPALVNTQKADLQEMWDLFATWDPVFRTLLGMVRETSKWRLQSSIELRKWSHAGGKFALLGDACHATLPYLAQGAAMAIEDGAVLGALMEKVERKAQLRDILVIYEGLRKPRTTAIVNEAAAYGETYHLEDGERQRERDRQFVEEEPFRGFPNRWRDPVLQRFLFGYDAHAEVEKAWETYKMGRWPLTYGEHGLKSNL